MNPPPEWQNAAKHKANAILMEVFFDCPLKAPVPIDEIIEAYVGDVQIVVSFDSIFPEGVSAITSKDMYRGWLIIINGREPVYRQRFSLAHELGHITVLPHQRLKEYCSDRSDDWVEKLCDRFAGDILMPDMLLRRMYRTTPVPHLDYVATYFKVSRQVAEIQLKRRGFSFTVGAPF
ncbi:MAG: ImmA/IrrE family metallo-endopeptidase [Minisyncoccia bacterium]